MWRVPCRSNSCLWDSSFCQPMTHTHSELYTVDTFHMFLFLGLLGFVTLGVVRKVEASFIPKEVSGSGFKMYHHFLIKMKLTLHRIHIYIHT